MTIFTNTASSDYTAIDGTIDGDTLHVGCVMGGKLRPGLWLVGCGYEEFMIERQIASRPGPGHREQSPPGQPRARANACCRRR